jgi:flagellar operon protein
MKKVIRRITVNDNMIYYQPQPFIPIGNRVQTAQQREKAVSVSSKTANASFKDILTEKLEKVQFSQHAQARMKSRNIELTAEQMNKLGNAVDKMAGKGARESLIYLNDMAFVVSIKNRTVITAMDGESAKENVFTNIDSAVII